jgi:hypothetical protein
MKTPIADGIACGYQLLQSRTASLIEPEDTLKWNGAR